jgi:transposase InsO family protein
MPVEGRVPFRESSVVEERLRFVVLASQKQRRIKDLCVEFGISRETGYRWLKRYASGGASELGNRSRRPKNSPQRTKEAVEQAVVELRGKWPDWGAAKLAKILGEQTPAVKVRPRTAHRILERYRLIDERDRRRKAETRFERSRPNELWQMDFKGPQGFNQGSGIGPLSVLDDHSRYLLVLQHLGSTRLEGVRNALRETFQQCGLPEIMLMDHGTPWWNGASPWGLTELSVWIMRLGIRLTYSGLCHPQTQGKVERMHGALQRAVRKRKGNPEDQTWLDSFRQEYNQVRPHEALAMATPSSRWQPSPRVFPTHLADWEYADHMQPMRLGGEGQLSWHGRRWEISNALRGLLVGLEILDSRVLVYFCNTPMRELNLQTGAAVPIQGKPLRSLQC